MAHPGYPEAGDPLQTQTRKVVNRVKSFLEEHSYLKQDLSELSKAEQDAFWQGVRSVVLHSIAPGTEEKGGHKPTESEREQYRNGRELVRIINEIELANQQPGEPEVPVFGKYQQGGYIGALRGWEKIRRFAHKPSFNIDRMHLVSKDLVSRYRPQLLPQLTQQVAPNLYEMPRNAPRARMPRQIEAEPEAPTIRQVADAHYQANKAQRKELKRLAEARFGVEAYKTALAAARKRMERQ
jgi:hypothetical protein